MDAHFYVAVNYIFAGIERNNKTNSKMHKNNELKDASRRTFALVLGIIWLRMVEFVLMHAENETSCLMCSTIICVRLTAVG